MNKREARQIALHMIFEMEFKSKEDWANILDTRLEPSLYSSLSEEAPFYAKKLPKPLDLYVKNCVNGVSENIDLIDETIKELSKDWDIKRLSKVTLAILRLAIYEIKFQDEIPVGASINEAVDLAKEYDSDESGSFINGILGTLSRQNNG